MTSRFADIDISKTKLQDSVSLDQVGMSGIESQIRFKSANGEQILAPATIDAFVSLDQPEKGIHMSRLFLSTQAALAQSDLCPELLVKICHDFLKSQAGLSQRAYVSVHFDLMLLRPALISSHKGWRRYPVKLWARVGSNIDVGADLSIKYSSTCPCSAALARQLIQDQFSKDFSQLESIDKSKILEWLGRESSIAGTPHGQRSEGRVKLMLREQSSDLHFLADTIEALEAALATPVQTAVKREDEQEFARLNASNLMFAEDAARRMHKALTEMNLFSGTYVEACHIESLHAHDAVARVASGTMVDKFT